MLFRSRTEYTTTVCLDAHPGTDGPSYALSSGITNQVARALQEVSGDALVLLRTHDPVMKVCTRYVYFPRLDLSNGDVLFPNPGDTTPALTSLLQYTSHLHQYLQDTLLRMAVLRAHLTSAEAVRAPGAVPPRPIPHPAAPSTSSGRGSFTLLSRPPRSVAPPPLLAPGPALPPRSHQSLPHSDAAPPPPR